MKFLSFFKSLSFFRFFLLILLSFSSFLFSQQAEARIQTPPTATIVLKDGAKIFSTDDNFNQHLLDSKAILKNADLSYQENSLEITSKLKVKKKKGLKDQLKIAEEKKQKEILKKIKKQIAQHKEKSRSYLNDRLNGFPTSEEFIANIHNNQDYVASNYNGHDFSKIGFVENTHTLYRALDFLHSQKFTYYNNKSLDYCFSEVFSVRPPPIYS